MSSGRAEWNELRMGMLRRQSAMPIVSPPGLVNDHGRRKPPSGWSLAAWPALLLGPVDGDVTPPEAEWCRGHARRIRLGEGVLRSRS